MYRLLMDTCRFLNVPVQKIFICWCTSKNSKPAFVPPMYTFILNETVCANAVYYLKNLSNYTTILANYDKYCLTSRLADIKKIAEEPREN